MTTSVSTTPSTPIVPVVQPMLPPGYGMLHMQDAWYPCRIRNGTLVFIAASPLDPCPFVQCSTYDEALQFCREETALEQYEDQAQRLKSLEAYPDRIDILEQLLFEQAGARPRWHPTEHHRIAVSICLDPRSASAEIVSFAPSLYQALLALAEEVERQRREADVCSWETWQQETVPVR